MTMIRPTIRMFRFPIALGLTCSALLTAAAAEPAGFQLQLRSRVESSPGSGRFHAVYQDETWAPRKTAVIVCDMWDLHHCLNATRRGAEVAPRMNEVLNRFRSAGSPIIHAPSSCMDFYKDHPARKRVADVPRAATFPEEIGEWCHRIPSEEKGTYPIDQSDGGEDDDPREHQKWAEELAAKGRNPRAPWIRQTELIEIDDRDYISDNGQEVWSILSHHGIDNVVLVGVHTNMCVLGRPFGLRNMARNNKHVVLMRDMTDTMYNPARAPYVSHFTGTDLIVEHIEKWVCPTVTSDQVLGGQAFRYSKDSRPRLAILCSEPEYRTEESLPPFALKHLGQDFQINLVFGDDRDGNRLPGLVEALEEADVALISVRRRALPADQMEALRRFVDSGKAIVGIRTANHAFSLRGSPPPEGHLTWETWDADVFGGNYTGHHGNGPKSAISAAKGSENHPLLRGVHANFVGNGSLYKVSPLAENAQAVLVGKIDGQPEEPVAWTYRTAAGGKVFYTSLGHIDDFADPAFQQLLTNALAWAAAK
jgi:type 1 glutamine amidotransferase/nicotinamidase-related amidase